MAITGKIKTLFSNPEKTEALFPRTKTSAVTNDDGISLDVLLQNVESVSPCPFVVSDTAPDNTNLLWIDTNATTGGLKYYNGSEWVHVPVAYTA